MMQDVTTHASSIRPSGYDSKAASLLMLLFPFSVLTTGFGVHLTLFLVLLSLGWLARRGLGQFYAVHGREIRFIVLAFGGYFAVSLLRMAWSGDSASTLDGPSRLLIALACIGFVGILRPSIRLFWIGMCLGTIAAAVYGGWQWLFHDMHRAMGATHHPISFGDLAVAMGVMSFCALPDFRHTRLAWLPLVALLCGVLASMFSGSRGAWLGLLLVLWPMMKYGAHLHGKTMRYAVGLVLAACLTSYLVPQTGVARRMADAVSEVERFHDSADATTNVGVRLELWKASGMMIAEHPWIGVGREQFRPTLLALAEEGRLQQSVALDYSSAHNDVLHTLATGGVLDLTFLLLMYGAPFAFFTRMLRHGPPAAAAPALAGLLLVICFIGFGLTDVMFWLMLTKAFYAAMICVLAGFCLAAATPLSATRAGGAFAPERILICRTDNIGDVVLTLPLAGYLKQRFPHARIDLLCRAYVAPAMRHSHNLHRVITIEESDDLAALFAAGAYDTVLFAFPDRRLARAAKHARVPNRVGTSHRLYHWLTCNRLAHFSRVKSGLHEAQLNFLLLRPLGIDHVPQLGEIAHLYGLATPRRAAVDALLTPERRHIILHPKSNGSAREWPLAHFTTLARELADTPDIRVFVTGSAAEGTLLAQQAPALLALPNVEDLCGRLDLDGLLALIGACDGLVACSTGPMHLSAALGRPTLGLFPPTKPMHAGRWAPLGPQAEVMCASQPCPGCADKATCACMVAITPQAVAARVRAWGMPAAERGAA